MAGTTVTTSVANPTIVEIEIGDQTPVTVEVKENVYELDINNAQGLAGAQGPKGDKGMNWTGPYNVLTEYAECDGVSYLGSSFIKVSPGTGTTVIPAIGVNPDWELVAQVGAGGSSLIYDQVTPSAVWSITHNLGRPPSVTVTDSGGSVVEGDVDYGLDPFNSLTITFSGAFSGQAYLV